jgi:hypothetical protein
MNYEKRKCACGFFILCPSTLSFRIAGFPLASAVSAKRLTPRDQRRNYKTRCGAWNKEQIREFASGIWTG